MAGILTKKKLEDADIDVGHAGEAVNTKKVINPRYGEPFKSIPLVVEEGEAEISNLRNAIDIAAAAGAGANGWTAQLIADASGKNQQEINNNTAYFYRTVTEMVADVKLTDGVIVGTKGYHDASDKGGATYLISTTPTSYSIPLANGLHAVFNDVFDVRKFGLRDDPTFAIDQTEEIRRMINYADNRIYEIDFHGLRIKTPEIVSHTSNRAVTFRGMPFHKVHTLKNLELRHNRGADLTLEGLIGIGFYPKSVSDVSGLFKLSNVKFDPILQNYSTAIGESDAAFIGFHASPHPDWGYSMWNVQDPQEFPIDFDFQDIDFKSPAMSYNISVSAWKSRKITWNNLTGDFLGLYVFPFATKITGDSIRSVYRNDLHTVDRALVISAVRFEPETGSAGHATIDLLDLSNIDCKDNNGNLARGFSSYMTNYVIIKDLRFKNFNSYASVVTGINNDGRVIKATIDNVSGYNFNSLITELDVNNCDSKPWQVSSSRNDGQYTSYRPFNATVAETVRINGGKISGILAQAGDYTIFRIVYFNDLPITATDYLFNTPQYDTYLVQANNVHFLTNPKFVKTKFDVVELNNVKFNFGYPISDFIARGSIGGGTINVNNSTINPQSGNLTPIEERLTVVFVNVSSPHSLVSLVPSSGYVQTRNSTFADIVVPSGSTQVLAKDEVFQVSTPVDYARIGDSFEVSSPQALLGCLLFAKVATNGTVTIYCKNLLEGSASMNGVSFNLKIKQLR